MTKHELMRALRLITSSEFRRKQRFPITVLANLSGLHRNTIYQARAGNGITRRVVETLSPLLSDIIAGRMTALCQHGYSVAVEVSGSGEYKSVRDTGRYSGDTEYETSNDAVYK